MKCAPFGELRNNAAPSQLETMGLGAGLGRHEENKRYGDKGFGDVSMNSFNHYACGAIGQWMYDGVAGLAPAPLHPGYKHYFVRPLVAGPLDFARAELETSYGKAVSSWSKRGNKILTEHRHATQHYRYRRISRTA